MNLQPVTTPCKRSDTDLHVNIRKEKMLEIYSETPLPQRIPCDSSSMLFRIMAGVIVNQGVPSSQFEKASPVCDKTLHTWDRALKAKTPLRMQALLSGVYRARRELSAEQKHARRMRYSKCKDRLPLAKSVNKRFRLFSRSKEEQKAPYFRPGRNGYIR